MGLGLAALSAPAAPVSPQASAEAFLRGLYAKYAPGGKPTPFVYPEAAAIVDAPMLALLKTDRDRSNGEVGAMDMDPICRCQDWQALKVASLSVSMTGADAATADVTFSDLGERQTLHFSLVRSKAGWRIHDIGSKDEPSLAAYLKSYKY